MSRFEAELMWRDRNDGPHVLWEWWYLDQIPPEEFKRLLPQVWCMAEWPTSALGVRTWLTMFKSVDFVTDRGATAPEGPVTIYRGADQRSMRGFSWSTDIREAAWFADRSCWRTPGQVYKAEVPPHAVLGELVGRNEPEVLVNPYCLRGGSTPRIVPNPPRYPTVEEAAAEEWQKLGPSATSAEGRILALKAI